MTTQGWSGAAIAGLLVATLGACAHEKKPAAAAAPGTQQAQQAQRANEQVAQADRELAEARKRLEAAHQEVATIEQQRAQARQQLAQAEQKSAQTQQRIAQEQANVERLDAAARQQRERAARAAEQAQLAAEQAQGLRSAAGRIAEATPSRVILEGQDGQTTVFQIDQRTTVLVGTERRSVAELQQGADARVAYDPKGNQPAAVTIHVTPARDRPPAPAQAVPPQR